VSGAGKVAAVGMTAAVCALVLRKREPELGLALAVCAGALVLMFCGDALRSVTEFLDTLAEAGGLSPTVVAIVLKVTGIAVVTQLAAHFCKDAKEGGLAAVVETAGSLLALVEVLPLMSAVLDLIVGLL
jgi:stage III sporulation protein AD